MIPYRWQEDCIKKWKEESATGYIEAVTGSGKTYLAVFALQHLLKSESDTKTLVVVPRVALALQWKQAFIKNGFTPNCISVRGGGRKNPADNDIVIYVVNTARYELARNLLKSQAESKHVFLIADEYHHYFSRENKRIFDFASSIDFKRDLYRYLGISATPGKIRTDSCTETVIGHLFYRYGLEEALKDNVVSPFAIYNIKIDLTHEEKSDYYELSQKITKLLRIVASIYPSVKLKQDFAEYLLAVRKIASEEDCSLVDSLLNLLFLRRDLIASKATS